MAEEQNETQVVEEESGGGGLMRMLMFGGIGLALLAAGVFGGPMITNLFSPSAEEEEVVEEGGAVSNEPEIYQSLHPPLVVNFKDAAGNGHFMQITMEVMSRDQGVINAVREHTPAIRNALILMLGNTDYDAVVTREGKEQMLSDALAEIQKVMQQRTGETGIEEVFFTSLIIQ